MTGGNRTSGYEDGYDKTPEELAKAEQAHDDLEALEAERMHIELKRWNGDVIFSGEAESLREVVKKNRANLEGANLRGAYLEGANLRGAYLRGAYLEGANLEGANLRGANLRGAYLEGANLGGANLRGANLRGAYLRGAYLEGANLEGANLEGANLRGAYLEGANLRGAYLRGAYLEGANLEGANLRGANLRGAYLRGAYLEGATYGEGIPLTLEPLGLRGLKWFVLILDIHLKIGCELHSFEEWQEKGDAIARKHGETDWWNHHKEAIFALIKAVRG